MRSTSNPRRNLGEFKDSPIGSIPLDWDCVPLSSVAQVQTGISKSSNRKLKHPKKFPYLRVANVQDGFLDLSQLKSIEIEESDFSRYALKWHDVLFTEGGDFDKLGRGTIWECQIENCIHQNHIFAVRVDINQILPEWLAFVAESKIGRDYFLRSSKQSTNLASINSSQLKSFIIPFPKIFIQKICVEILSAFSKAISRYKQLIKLKRVFKCALMTEFISGRIRFPEFGKPVNQIGQTPDGWYRCHLGDVFNERNETDPSLPLLSITADSGIIPRDEVDRKDTSNSDKSKYKRIVHGDIGYNTMRMWQGVSAVSSFEGIVSPAYTVCVPKEKCYSEYFGHLFKSPSMIHRFHRYSQGLVDDTLNLKFHHFAQIAVDVPPLSEQKKIARVLSVIDREIALLNQVASRLQVQKEGLMQQLLTGKIRVGV